MANCFSSPQVPAILPGRASRKLGVAITQKDSHVPQPVARVTNVAIIAPRLSKNREFGSFDNLGAMMATLGETFSLDQVNSVAFVNDA